MKIRQRMNTTITRTIVSALALVITVRVNPQREFAPVAGATTWQDTLPRNSLTIYSTFHLDHDDPGIMLEPGTSAH
jgi:hypothetical protein